MDGKNKVRFVADVQEYYNSSGFFLLYDDQSESFKRSMKTRAYSFIKRLAMKGVSCQAIPYKQLKENRSTLLSYSMQSLFAVFFSLKEHFLHFSNITKYHDMSYNNWLIVFSHENDSTMQDICQNPVGNPFHLVFNSRMIVTCPYDDRIRKWYSSNDNLTEVIEFARWNNRTGIKTTNKNYYKDRFNLYGKTLKYVTHTQENIKLNGKMMGFFWAIIDELANAMNFTSQIVGQADGFGKRSNDSQDYGGGLLDFLIQGKADVIVSPTTMTHSRLEVLDFTRPILLTANRIYFRQPDGARVHWASYFRVYDADSWLVIIIALITASLMIFFISKLNNHWKRMKARPNYIVENLFYIWGVYCQQGVQEFPPRSSLRLIYLTILLLTFILWAIYSASITSYLTLLLPTIDFADIDSFINDGTYQLIVIQNSSYQYSIMEIHFFTIGIIMLFFIGASNFSLLSNLPNLFKRSRLLYSDLDPILSQLRPFLKNVHELPTNGFSAFEQVCNERVGFYASVAIREGVSAEIPCALTYIETGQFECLAMALAKRSPYITSINYNLRKMEDMGVLKKLRRWHFRKFLDELPPNHIPVSIWSIVPLLAILAGGFVSSILILFFEQLGSLVFNREFYAT